jgi:hypothetical protein
MVDEALLSWIKDQLSLGTSLEQIKQGLSAKGWQDADINEAISIAQSSAQLPVQAPVVNPQSTNQQPASEEQKKKSPKLFFFIAAGVLLLIIGVVLFIVLSQQKDSEINSLASNNNGITNNTLTDNNTETNNSGANNTETTNNTLTNNTETANESVNTTSAVLECGTDFTCLVDYSENCTLSNVTSTETLSLFGVNSTSVTYYEIKGSEEGKCLLYNQPLFINATFPEGTSQETIDAYQNSSQGLIGTNGTCQFNTPDLTALLRNWDDGNYTSEDLDSANCTGSYFDYIALP